MLDAAARTRLLARHGADAEAWLDALPTRLSALAERWWVALDLASPPFAGGTSVVARGWRDGVPVMLKLAFDPRDAAVEAGALRAWGAGPAPPVPRLLADDTAAGALLLESIEPGTPLIADPSPPPVEACGALLRGLRAPAPPAGTQPLSERVEWIFELWLARHAAEPAPRAAVPTGLLERGRAAARELADDRAAPVALVHGDLHAGNVLDGGPVRGLVAIDPRPCVGDPAFDAADLVLHGVTSADRARERAAAVAARTGDDPDRVAGWCAALAALDAAALASRPAPPAPAALAALLALAV